MALAHHGSSMHRLSRSDSHDDESYGAELAAAGVENMAVGSVTSFVRKLFQMVQGECDSVVGFVADGTAFEVKDPRRLEQDILPKYFRHSRFQSLVRQLNFYSFKKISKERSVWIYKHAFFRRDEPELLHALKRKTNQHGGPTRIPGMMFGDTGDEAVEDRERPSSVLREPHDTSKSRLRGPSPTMQHTITRHHQHHPGGGGSYSLQHGRSAASAHYEAHDGHHRPVFHQVHREHHAHRQLGSVRPDLSDRERYAHPSESLHAIPPPHLQQQQQQHHHQHHHHESPNKRVTASNSSSSNSNSNSNGHGREYQSSTSRSAGGSPSTGGVGGAAAAPCYSGRAPSSSSSSSRAHGYPWPGAGGHPVTASGGVAAASAEHDDGECEMLLRATSRAPPPLTAVATQRQQQQQQQHHQMDVLRRRPDSPHGMTASSRAYRQRRQGPAVSDARDNEVTKTAPAEAVAPLSSKRALPQEDREQALALYGLSALCQVASATKRAASIDAEAADADAEARRGGDGVRRSVDDRYLEESDSRVGERSARRFEGGDDRLPKRPCVGESLQDLRRTSWSTPLKDEKRNAKGGMEGGKVDPSDDDDEAEEDGITSAERDDSFTSFRSHSGSEGSGSDGDRDMSDGASGSRNRGSDDATRGLAMQNESGRGQETEEESSHDEYEDDRQGRGAAQGITSSAAAALSAREETSRDSTSRQSSGSGGVFCPTWAWGKAASKPAVRLPGSFVDRRFERAHHLAAAAEAADAAEAAADDERRGDLDEQERAGRQEGGSKYIKGEDMDEDDPQAGEEGVQGRSREESYAERTPLDQSKGAPEVSTPQPRDLEADMEAEAQVGLQGIGELFAQIGARQEAGAEASNSDFLATVTNSGDCGLREMAVFCAGPAGRAPDTAPPSTLARQVASFLHSEEAVAQDLRVYAEALDPAAVDVVGRTIRCSAAAAGQDSRCADGDRQQREQDAKLLRVFCRYAACRMGRAHELASRAAASSSSSSSSSSDASSVALGDGEGEKAGHGQAEGEQQHQQRYQRQVARRLSPRLDECRWKWWRAAVRFS